MRASSATTAAFGWADFRSWDWWKLPWRLRAYVALVILGALALFGYAAADTTWTSADLGKFALLLGVGLFSVALTPRMAYVKGGMTRDFTTVWVLPVAVLLPPVYCIVTPLPLLALTQWRINRGVVHRRVFTVAAIGCSYGFAAFVFRWLPGSFAGSAIGTGVHALTWTAAVALCELIGRRGHGAFIMGAIKISNPDVRVIQSELTRESVQADLAEFDLGVVVTVVVGVNVFLAIIAVPTVLLIRRFMMHAQLLAKSRIDTKTGLLNASTWESEAATEIARCVRASVPVSVGLIDIDHFKLVNDTHGHLAGDKVLKAMGEEIRQHLRHTDMAGRFGGEEFVVLLPNADEEQAQAVAERLRQHIAATPIPVGDDPEDARKLVELTISVGVAALTDDCREITDLLAAADAALYYAKQHGRNRTHAINATEHKRRLVPVASAPLSSAGQTGPSLDLATPPAGTCALNLDRTSFPAPRFSGISRSQVLVAPA
jgi:diguanylate cyclase (GGDEF)-like protein